MKKILSIFILLFILLSPISSALAVHVNGYYRSNGTYVNGYERTAPDGNPYNNYSYPGNYNPNTGTITGGNPDTYLNNYYNRSSGSSYYPSLYNTYPTRPTCPLNSYYDGISSCKCNYGYTLIGGSCVSLDDSCHDQIGYSSSYDSLTGNCKCYYGYIIGSSGKCVNANMYCSDILGLMSEYNSLSKKCECMSGYEFNGSTCVYKTTTPSTYSNTYTCPLNSHTSLTDISKCDCDVGYQTNVNKDACVPIVTSIFPIGCTSTTGFSTITGLSCDGINNKPKIDTKKTQTKIQNKIKTKKIIKS